MNDKSQIEEGLPITYFSSLQCYTDEACTPTCHMIEILRDGYVCSMSFFYDNHTFMAFLGHIHNIFDEILFWLMTKHKERGSIVDKELRWFHWLYAYT